MGDPIYISVHTTATEAANSLFHCKNDSIQVICLHIEVKNLLHTIFLVFYFVGLKAEVGPWVLFLKVKIVLKFVFVKSCVPM